MQFVPLWTSILRSRKVATLPDDLYRLWTHCLLLAQEHDHRQGSLPTPDDLSYALHKETSWVLPRLAQLVAMRFLHEEDGVYYIHDWQEWKYQRDPTATARKRAERERKRQQGDPAPRQAGRDNAPSPPAVESGVTAPPRIAAAMARPAETATRVTPVTPVTPVTRDSHSSVTRQSHAPTTVPQLNSTQLNTHPLPPLGAGLGVGVGEEEPFDPGPPRPEETPPPWTPEEARVVEKALRRWGDKHGDVIVGDLLRDFGPAIVSAAIDAHYDRAGSSLSPSRLRGTCQSMYRGDWKLPNGARAAPSPAPTPQTIPIDVEAMRAQTEAGNRAYAEYLKRMEAARAGRQGGERATGTG